MVLCLISLRGRGYGYGRVQMPGRDRNEKTAGTHGGADKAERRDEARASVDQPAVIKVLNPLQPSSRILASVVETSRAGMKLRLDRDLMPGTLVQIRIRGKLLLAEVRFCNPAGAGFLVGVRLQDIFETNI